MFQGLIPFPTPYRHPLLLGVIYRPFFSSLHSPLFILEKQAVKYPSSVSLDQAWIPKSSCLQMPSLSQAPKPVCLLSFFLLPATTQTLNRKIMAFASGIFLLLVLRANVLRSVSWVPTSYRGHGWCQSSAAGSRGKKEVSSSQCQ